jgi:hypothetical protein
VVRLAPYLGLAELNYTILVANQSLYLGFAELDEAKSITRNGVDNLCDLGLVTVAVGGRHVHQRLRTKVLHCTIS